MYEKCIDDSKTIISNFAIIKKNLLKHNSTIVCYEYDEKQIKSAVYSTNK